MYILLYLIQLWSVSYLVYGCIKNDAYRAINHGATDFNLQIKAH
jgi:hypothetical protein